VHMHMRYGLPAVTTILDSDQTGTTIIKSLHEINNDASRSKEIDILILRQFAQSDSPERRGITSTCPGHSGFKFTEAAESPELDA